MSLLAKIRGSEIQKPQPAPAKTPAPSVECPICDCPYWWRDIYAGPDGPWRCCACCEPPHDSLVSEHVDVRRNEVGEALSDEERDFGREWVTATLIDLHGQAWTATARRDARRGQCPADMALMDWAAGLRTKLVTEW
jgi:hypothetical protein